MLIGKNKPVSGDRSKEKCPPIRAVRALLGLLTGTSVILLTILYRIVARKNNKNSDSAIFGGVFAKANM